MTRSAAEWLQARVLEANPASKTRCVAHPDVVAPLLKGGAADWRDLVTVAEEVLDLRPRRFRVGVSGHGDRRAEEYRRDWDFLVVVGNFAELHAARIAEVVVGTAIWDRRGHDQDQHWERLGAIEGVDKSDYIVYLAVQFSAAKLRSLPDWFLEEAE